MIQIWSALITILLLKVMKAMAKYGWHLSNLVAFIRLNIFIKIDLKNLLDRPFEEHNKPPDNPAQGIISFAWKENGQNKVLKPNIWPSKII